MRTIYLSATLAACLITPALAQSGVAPAYPPPNAPPPGYNTAPAPGYNTAPAYPAYPQPGPMTGQAAPPAGYQTGGPPGGAAPGGAQYEPPGAMPMSRGASNINPQDTQSDLAPNLPAAGLGQNAGPIAYLRAAESALAAGRTGEAQQALEQAETRLLDRSVPLGEVNAPSANPAVADINEALQALAAGNRGQCMQSIQAAIPAAQASLR